MRLVDDDEVRIIRPLSYGVVHQPDERVLFILLLVVMRIASGDERFAEVQLRSEGLIRLVEQLFRVRDPQRASADVGKICTDIPSRHKRLPGAGRQCRRAAGSA
jgi:hypothetical protein